MNETNRLHLEDFDDNISKLKRNLAYLEDTGALANVSEETQLRIDNTVWLFEKILEQAEKLMEIALVAHGVSNSAISGMTFAGMFGKAVELKLIDEQKLFLLQGFWRIRNKFTHDYISKEVDLLLNTAPSLVPIAEELNVLFSELVQIEEE